MYHQLLKRTFFLMTLCGSVMLSAGDDAWSKSGSHYSYTRTGKIAPESLPDGSIKYTFSLGCPEYPFDAGTGSCTPGDLKYSGNATRGPASGVTGTVEYGKDELPTSDTSMSMSGKLIPPEGAEGSQPTWSASATLQTPFWLEASPSDIVKAGTAVTVTAKGDPTESTWTIDGTDWKDHSQSNSKPYKTSSITLNRNMWDKLKWTPNPLPTDYLFPPAGTYSISATTTEEGSARSAGITVTVVELTSLSVVAGATQTNVTNTANSNNWAAVKGNDYIVVKANISPSIPEDKVPSDLIQWTGGEAIAGQPLHRRVSKATSQKTTVKATCGNVEKEVDLWVIWANITIHTSGKQPSDAKQLGSEHGGTNLGPYESSTRVGASMTLEATLTPSGINGIVKTGWKIKRSLNYRDWRDGIKTEATNQNDDSYSSWVVDIPTTSDKIYDTDAPNHTKTFINFAESHNNFVQGIEWNSDRASDDANWSVEYKYTNAGGVYTKIYNRISTNHITIPQNPTNP